jgi:LmbE family N-acetylglucosaminyl deacetylase
MANKILVVAPHADDETLGCGGSLLKHKKNGDKIYWLLVTKLKKDHKDYNIKQKEIKKVADMYNFDEVINLNLEPAKIHKIDFQTLIKLIEKQLKLIKPDTIYVPYLNDIHSDHQIIARAMNTFSKWFRYPYIKRFLVYETLSETNFNFINTNFEPNLFVDISDQMKKKLNILKIYRSEISTHPFPRSQKSVESLAIIRGSSSGYKYAEAFKIIIERK